MTYVGHLQNLRYQPTFLYVQVYIPLYIIVMSSWVTFWLVKTDKGQETPARTQLGATTVLAVVTIGFGGKAKPQVGHPHYVTIIVFVVTITHYLSN